MSHLATRLVSSVLDGRRCPHTSVSLIALILRAFGSSTQRFFRILMMSLMWHNDQKSVCALVLAIVNEAQTA